MYSGTTLTNSSGVILGAHQKIDKVARKNLELYVGDAMRLFPLIKDILYFEGKNGPDGIKRKSSKRDEPSHFYDPFNEEDTQLIEIIDESYTSLVRELAKENPERAAFDAAWIAHAIVDGLTPAHHYPYQEKAAELRGDESGKSGLKDKIVIPGDTLSESISKNWAMWGVKGLMSSHGLFEIGVASILAPIKMKSSQIRDSDIQNLQNIGYQELFVRAAREIALLDMYGRFLESGWTIKLSRDARNHLGPIMIRTVSLVWYSALKDASLLKEGGR